jgi:hypothetical protein
MKITKVTFAGCLDFRRLFAGNYHSTETELKKEGLTLPSRDVLDLNRNTDYHVLLRDLCIAIHFEENKQVYKYTFLKGFLTDFASVPKLLRGLVDNDDLRLMFASLVHDANFGLHLLSFRESNWLFFKMIKAQNGTWWLATKAWLAVSTAGWFIWRRKLDKKNTPFLKYLKKTLFFAKSK